MEKSKCLSGSINLSCPHIPVALFPSSHLNCILNVISYALSPVQSTSVARGCWFVTCLAWGSASLGHSHSPEPKPTGKLINTQAPYKGLVLDSLAQPHICLCLCLRSPLHPHTPGKNYSQHVWRNTLPRVTRAGKTGKAQALIKKAEQQSWIVQFQAGLRLWVIRLQVECIIFW